MRNNENRIKKLDKDKKTAVYAVSILFTVFYYGLGYMVSYQPDIYLTVNNPYGMVRAMYYTDGRWMNALIYYIFRHPGQPYSVFYGISFCISLALMVFSIIVYGKTIISEVSLCANMEMSIRQYILIMILACLTIANMFTAEFFLYPDMTMGYIFAILLCVWSLNRLIRYFHNGGIEYLVTIFICLFLCVFMAETTAAIYVILSVPFVLLYSDSFKAFVVRQVIAGIPYGLAMFCKLAFTMFVVKSSRAVNNKAGLAETAGEFAPQGSTPQQYVFDRITFGMWIYMVIFVAVVISLTIIAIKRKEKYKILTGIYIVVVTGLFGLLPYIFRLTNDYKPRIYYPVGVIIGTLVGYGICIRFIDLEVTKVYKTLMIALSVLAVVQWLSFVQMFMDQYITNYEDKFISEIIGNSIDEYEMSNNIKISKVVFYADATRTKYSRNEGWCITQRAYDAVWSKLPALNYYLGTHYTEGETDDELAEYFNQNDWDTFSSGQIVFKGDTIHICTF